MTECVSTRLAACRDLALMAGGDALCPERKLKGTSAVSWSVFYPPVSGPPPERP
jgi:hypothetical protein